MGKLINYFNKIENEDNIVTISGRSKFIEPKQRTIPEMVKIAIDCFNSRDDEYFFKQEERLLDLLDEDYNLLERFSRDELMSILPYLYMLNTSKYNNTEWCIKRITIIHDILGIKRITNKEVYEYKVERTMSLEYYSFMNSENDKELINDKELLNWVCKQPLENILSLHSENPEVSKILLKKIIQLSVNKRALKDNLHKLRYFVIDFTIADYLMRLYSGDEKWLLELFDTDGLAGFRIGMFETKYLVELNLKYRDIILKHGQDDWIDPIIMYYKR